MYSLLLAFTSFDCKLFAVKLQISSLDKALGIPSTSDLNEEELGL